MRRCWVNANTWTRAPKSRKPANRPSDLANWRPIPPLPEFGHEVAVDEHRESPALAARP